MAVVAGINVGVDKGRRVGTVAVRWRQHLTSDVRPAGPAGRQQPSLPPPPTPPLPRLPSTATLLCNANDPMPKIFFFLTVGY